MNTAGFCFVFFFFDKVVFFIKNKDIRWPNNFGKDKKVKGLHNLALRLKVKFQSRQKGIDLNIEIEINRIEENLEINPHTYD